MPSRVLRTLSCAGAVAALTLTAAPAHAATESEYCKQVRVAVQQVSGQLAQDRVQHPNAAPPSYLTFFIGDTLGFYASCVNYPKPPEPAVPTTCAALKSAFNLNAIRLAAGAYGLPYTANEVYRTASVVLTADRALQDRKCWPA